MLNYYYFKLILSVDPGYKKLPVFNEENIKSYKSPFGEMARDIMNYD